MPLDGDKPPRFGAYPEDWRRFDALGVGSDLLPVVSNPHAKIAATSSIKQLGKTPSRYNADREVIGIARWTDYQASDAELKRWAAEPDYGICIQTRSLRALDADITDPDLANAVAEEMDNFYPWFVFPTRYRANSPKWLMAFYLEGEFTKRVMRVRGGAIEFLASGQQFIAAGTHPSGARYEWLADREFVPRLYPKDFEALWEHLTRRFAIQPPTVSKPAAERRDVLLDVEDPVADWLEAEGLVLSETNRGGLVVECPWADEHSGGEAGDTSTVWFRAGTGGHLQGHFRCQHAHCEHRNRSDFLTAIGYPDNVADDFEDLGPDPEGAGSANTSAKSRFEVIPAGEFVKRPAPAWLVKNLIPVADLIVLYGESGSGKSFVMIDIAMAVARGVPWRGLKTRAGRVVYIAAEGGGGFRNRLLAYAQQHGIADLNEIPFGVIHAAPNFLEKADVSEVADAIKAGGPVAMIVTDTFAQVTAGANENSGEDMGKALRNARLISDACGAPMVLVHHSGKDASKGARGWSGIRAAADAELEVTKDGEMRGTLHTTKQKDGDDTSAWGFTRESITIGIDDEGEDITSCVVLEAAVAPRAAVSKRAKPLGDWEKAVLDTYSELAVGGDVSKTDLIHLVADKRPEVGTLRDRRKNARRAVEGLCSGKDALLISEKGENHVSLRT
jgi:hypothetical protein